MTKTGVKVGRNYLNYFLKRSIGSGSSPNNDKQLLEKNARDIYSGLAQLRGTALKLAQSMSLDAGVMPVEFAEVMAQAQYRVPPMNKALVRATIKRELGDYPDQLFRHFSDDCLAAASLGQVHLAELDDKVRLAVKVQYPDVRAGIETDLSLAFGFFKRFVSGSDIASHFTELRQRLLEETDYLRERDQMVRFNERWTHPKIVTPRPVPRLCTQRVLTMSYVEGRHLDEFLKENPSQHARNHYGQVLWDLLHGQIRNEEYTIHADLHPGNFLFRADGSLGVLDFGCVKQFPIEFIQGCLLALRAHLEGNDQDIRRSYGALGLLDAGGKSSKPGRSAFLFFRDFVNLALSPYRVKRFDFGQRQFRETLVNYFKEAMGRAEVAGSPHFIFLNRAMFGLYALLMRLNAVVDTNESRGILTEAAERV